MFTAHTTWAMSATTSALDVVPFGVATVVDCSQSGRAGGNPLLVEGLAGWRRRGSAAAWRAGRRPC